MAQNLQKVVRLISKIVADHPGDPAADLANWIARDNPELIAALEHPWALEKLRALVAAELRRQYPIKDGRPGLGNPNQGRLPGYENIPYRFAVEPSTRKKEGRRIYLRDATLKDLLQRLEFVQSGELPDLKRLIAEMRPYDQMQPGITVREVMKLKKASRKKKG